jgi:hypothetical protein
MRKFKLFLDFFLKFQRKLNIFYYRILILHYKFIARYYVKLLKKHMKDPQIFFKIPFEKFIFFNILITILLLLLLLGWLRPSHPAWIETGSVQLSRVGLIVDPTSFFSLFFLLPLSWTRLSHLG